MTYSDLFDSYVLNDADILSDTAPAGVATNDGLLIGLGVGVGF